MIKSYKFQSLNSEEIKKVAVIEIKQVEDLHSPKLGATQTQYCGTCNSSFEYCCGHLGYIQLNTYIIKPIMQAHLLDILKTFCIKCKKVHEKPCAIIQPIYYSDKINQNMIQFFVCDGVYLNPLVNQVVIINPEYIYNLLQRLKIADDLLINVVPVISNALRQVNTQQNSNIFNNIYQKIIETNDKLHIKWIRGTYIYGLTKEQLRIYDQFQIACRIIMYKDTAKSPSLQIKNQMLRALDHSQNVNEACSPFAAFIAKKGWGRQICNSNRVNQSCRTVITGNPYLRSWQVICPLDIAKEIQIPLMVNNVNILKCKELIKNYPNYPCVTKVKSKDNKYFKKVTTDQTQQTIYNNLKVGDIVYRQAMNNDVCLVNRYPSIREESFGQHIIKIGNTQTIQFNLQVIKKMQADFDGDEMQLYFMASTDNNMELLLLSSMQRQLITYESGLNIIGGAPDLDAGVFNLQDYKQLSSIINKIIPNLNYKSDSLLIENGVIKKLSTQIADRESQFITYISQKYGPTKAIQITDETLQYLYKINNHVGTTLYSKIFTKINDPYTQLVLDKCRQINIHHHSQLIYDKQQHTADLIDAMTEYQMKQVEQIYPTLSVEGHVYYNKLITKFQEQLRGSCISIGQIYDDKSKRITQNERTLCCFPKFSEDVRTQGYIAGNYIQGLQAYEVFFESITGRKQLFDKGNQVSKDGYTNRRLTKGTNNTITGYNGIVFSDSNTVVSLQYGQGGYDPRCFQIVKIDESQVVDKQFYQLLLEIQDQLADNPYKQDSLTFQIPFKPQQDEITQEQLNNILTCRITENMSDEFKEIIYSQAWQFYSYCRLTMKINPNAKDYGLIEQYKNSLVAAGELVGLKAAHASTQPYTQATLHSIHKIIQILGQILVEKSIGAQRFMELVTNIKGPTTIRFKLLPEYDKNQFIQKYQKQDLSQLKPSFEIYYSSKRYNLKITFDIRILCIFNVYIKNIYNLLEQKLTINDVQFNQNQVIFQCSGQQNKLVEFCETPQTIQSSSLQNLVIKGDYIEGNIGIYKYHRKLQTLFNIFQLREIDITTIYCSNPHDIEALFGIQKAREVLYNELSNNLNSIDATRNVQSTHVQLLTDILTQTGYYKNFTSNGYKTQMQKDIIQLALFEYTNMFLQNYLTKQYKYNTDTLLNSTFFGTKPKAGSTYAEFYSNDYLYSQNIDDVIQQINNIKF